MTVFYTFRELFRNKSLHTFTECFDIRRSVKVNLRIYFVTVPYLLW